MTIYILYIYIHDISVPFNWFQVHPVSNGFTSPSHSQPPIHHPEEMPALTTHSLVYQVANWSSSMATDWTTQHQCNIMSINLRAIMGNPHIWEYDRLKLLLVATNIMMHWAPSLLSTNPLKCPKSPWMAQGAE